MVLKSKSRLLWFCLLQGFYRNETVRSGSDRLNDCPFGTLSLELGDDRFLWRWPLSPDKGKESQVHRGPPARPSSIALLLWPSSAYVRRSGNQRPWWL